MLNTPSKPLRIAGVISGSIVDGPGLRYVIFTQGCPHHCPGCHNPKTHDPKGGYEADAEQLLEDILADPILTGVTFSGGEPFAQAEALLPLAEELHARGIPLMIYTGYTYEQLLEAGNAVWDRLLALAELLVDGPYVESRRDLTLAFRGSANQRVIDLGKTKDQGRIVEYQSEYEEL